MAENDGEWPVTSMHADLMKRYPDLSENEQLCLAIHEIAYALRGLAFEQNAGANSIADAVFSLGEEDDGYGEEDDEAEDESQKGRRH